MFISTGERSFIERLAAHLESGLVVPAIQSRHTLDDAIDAMRHLESGTASGKVVVRIDSNEDPPMSALTTGDDRHPHRTADEGRPLQQRWHGWGSPVGLGLGLLCVGGFFVLLALGFSILDSIS